MRRLAGANTARMSLWVALLSIVPAIVIMAVTAIGRYHDEVALARSRGEHVLRLIAERQTAEVVGTLARMLCDLQRVRNADAAAISALFRTIADNTPAYDNIFLLRGDGSVIASGVPMPAEANFSQFVFFTRTLRRKAFSIGNVKDSRAVKKSVLYVGAPVDFTGGGTGVLGIALNLAWYGDLLSGLSVDRDAAVYLLDGTGFLTAASKAREGAFGDRPGGELWRKLQEQETDTGVFLAPDESGRRQLRVMYRKLLISSSDTDLSYFYALHLQPEASTYVGASALVWQELIFAGIVISLSLSIVLIIHRYAVRRPWRQLCDAAFRMGVGDFKARVPEAGMGGEIGILGKEFNSMADALEKHDMELTAARARAECSRKAKSEFLANMSHEIRTSMNAILGMGHLVLKTELSARQQGYVSKLLAAADDLLRIINDILDFSKMEAGKLVLETTSFSLHRLLEDIKRESVASVAEKRLHFRMTVDPAVPDTLLGDPLRLSQALSIIVDESVKRCNEQNDISMTCTVGAREGAEVTVVFLLRNAGDSLTPDQLADLLNLIGSGDGAGADSIMDVRRLRIAIVGRMFRLMGGNVTLESKCDQGVFVTATCVLSSGGGDCHRQSRFFEGVNALVIAPDLLPEHDLVESLKRLGVAVTCAPDLGSARAVLRTAGEKGSAYSVIFADWHSSSPDFPEEVLRMRNEAGLATVSRVILTIPAGRAALPIPESATVDALLPKPVKDSLLVDILMTFLDPPRVKDVAAPAPESGAPGDLADLRVLLVEDNAVNQQIAQEIMANEGIAVTVANNGAEAVALVNAGHGRWDLVLMDLQMPEMDGLAATRAVRALKGCDGMRLPIIAMTAHSDIREIAACFDAGMNDHTDKPIIVDAFLDTLRRWLPVRHEQASRLAEGAARLRAALAGAGMMEAEAVLQTLAPVLGEGRVRLLRTALAKDAPYATQSLLDALDALAEDLCRQGKGGACC